MSQTKVVVNVGSEGKEHFHRPLRIGPNSFGSAAFLWCHHSFILSLTHSLPLSFRCCSPLGAGVPAEAESEMDSACASSANSDFGVIAKNSLQLEYNNQQLVRAACPRSARVLADSAFIVGHFLFGHVDMATTLCSMPRISRASSMPVEMA